MGRSRLTRGFLGRSSIEVAPDLLGCVLEVDSDAGTVGVRMTEVEAYAGTDDPASHAYRGPTPRTEVMFGPPGYLYVYLSYGMHFCLNVVCGPPGTASAVLLRAGEVIDGVDLARSRRLAARRDVDLARGPARLGQAVALRTADSGLDLLQPSSRVRLWARSPGPAPVVVTGPRVGVSVGARRPWRFWSDGEPSVSPYKRSPRAAALHDPTGHPDVEVRPDGQNDRRD